MLINLKKFNLQDCESFASSCSSGVLSSGEGGRFENFNIGKITLQLVFGKLCAELSRNSVYHKIVNHFWHEGKNVSGGGGGGGGGLKILFGKPHVEQRKEIQFTRFGIIFSMRGKVCRVVVGGWLVDSKIILGKLHANLLEEIQFTRLRIIFSKRGKILKKILFFRIFWKKQRKLYMEICLGNHV